MLIVYLICKRLLYARHTLSYVLYGWKSIRIASLDLTVATRISTRYFYYYRFDKYAICKKFYRSGDECALEFAMAFTVTAMARVNCEDSRS